MDAKNLLRNAPARARADDADRSRRPVRKRGPYVSDSIVERRRRMIEAARRMIAEGHASGFTVRELARQAGVSVAVIYSAYGDKEGLIAAAIEDFYRSLPMARREAPSTLAGVLRGIDAATAVVLDNVAYSRALCDLYFSRTVDARVFTAIHNIAVDMIRPWLQHCVAEGETVPGLPFDDLCFVLARDRWSVLQAWSRGRIADDELSDATRLSFLMLAAGLSVGRIRARVDAELRKLARRRAVRRS